LQRGLDSIKQSLSIMSGKGKISEDEVSRILSRISRTTSFDQCTKEVDVVIESAPEKLDLKYNYLKILTLRALHTPFLPAIHHRLVSPH